MMCMYYVCVCVCVCVRVFMSDGKLRQTLYIIIVQAERDSKLQLQEVEDYVCQGQHAEGL